MEVRGFFATAVLFDTLVDENGLAALRAAVAEERARDPAGVVRSNVGGWHSNTQMLEWGGDAARALANRAIALASAQTIDAGSPDRSRYRWDAEMWANVFLEGHANQYHAHPGSFWSAVAYLDDGYEGSDDPLLGGELQLLDPRMPMVRMATPDLRMVEDGRAQMNEIAIRPRTGLMVLFPGWLQHGVRPFQGPGTRISVAINLVAARADA